jgi:SpoVK/Ycf46/Vps4 family AAA+-type ATPase
VLEIPSKQPRVQVIASTSKPWSVEVALRRRFPTRIYIQPPKASERTQFVKQLLATITHDITDDELLLFGQMTEGYSFADLATVVKQTKQHEGESLTFHNLSTTLQSIPPTIEASTLARFSEWTEEFG